MKNIGIKTALKGMLFILPFIIGFAGFMQLPGVSCTWAAYYAIRLYGLNTDLNQINFLVEIGRWSAPLVTATALLLIFKNLLTRLNNRFRAMSIESCSVYGEGEDVNLLLENLGKSGIKGNPDRPVPSEHHVLLLDDLDRAFQFIHRNKDRFSIYVRLRDISGMALQSSKLTAFSMEENCSLVYWQRYPAVPGEKIGVIGDAVFCDALLEQALLVNIFSERQNIAYHVWEPLKRFESLHLRLREITEMTDDIVRMHHTPWEQELETLSTMDRIILCGKSDINISAAMTLLTMVPEVKVDLYVQDETELAALLKEKRIRFFGQASELLTRDVILNESLTAEARAIHNHYRGRYPGIEPWENLSVFLRKSNLAAAYYFPFIRKLHEEGVDLETLTRLEHIRWSRFHYMYNWQYGEEKNSEKRTHPCLKPYDELQKEEQDKDRENVLLAIGI